MSKVPVIILSGFLGSGKTTLLLRLLHEAGRRNVKAAVLMNELGKQDVDGHIVSGFLPDVSVAKLLDGCVCCSIKSEVADGLERLLRQQPDVVFMELTGVANPEEIADALAEPRLIRRLELKRIVSVLDAEHVLEYGSIFSSDRELVHTLRRQIETADVLLVNKADLVASGRIGKIEKAVRKQNAAAPIYCTTHSAIDPDIVFADIVAGLPQQLPAAGAFTVLRHAHGDGDGGHHRGAEGEAAGMSYSRVRTVTIPIAPHARLTQRSVDAFLSACGRKLLRAKGYLAIDGGESYLLQYAGNRATWQRQPADSGTTGDDHYLVLIGLELDADRLREAWARATG